MTPARAVLEARYRDRVRADPALTRLLKPGGRVFYVNDNVRYAGETVPVDLILAEFAEAAGLEVPAILTLPHGKGNSSQQMGRHGREEVRKCVSVWEAAV
ncbi:MAG TPA: hypothetical protein PLG95_08625 [Methanoculleus sp.]|nr:hypothetical protein [Methanoculleus sp.]